MVLEKTNTRLAYLGLLAVMLVSVISPLPVYFHMMVTTLLIIYIGAHASVPIELSDDDELHKTVYGIHESDHWTYNRLHNEMEKMESGDAYKFPLIASAFLFSFYLVFKLVPQYYVNLVIKCYFFVFGVIVLAQNVAKLIHVFLPKNIVQPLDDKHLFSLYIPFLTSSSSPAPASSSTTTNTATSSSTSPTSPTSSTSTTSSSAPADNKIHINALYLISLLASLVFGAWYIAVDHWTASNVMGIAFCLQGIEMLSLGSFSTATILLVGLFFYDIFWVFGTEVMVTVAKNFNAPIKLLFPRIIDGAFRPSMLGLGDIVIPGVFVAYMLRMDYQNAHISRTAVRKWYFLFTFVGYFVGLSTTVFVMYQFQAAQPALLYLVPTCLGSALLAAILKGELKKVWNHSEGTSTDQHKKTDGDDDKPATEKGSSSSSPKAVSSPKASSSSTSSSTSSTLSSSSTSTKSRVGSGSGKTAQQSGRVLSSSVTQSQSTDSIVSSASQQADDEHEDASADADTSSDIDATTSSKKVGKTEAEPDIDDDDDDDVVNVEDEDENNGDNADDDNDEDDNYYEEQSSNSRRRRPKSRPRHA